VKVADGLDEQALVGLPRNDRRARVATGRPAGPAVQPEPALALLGPVTADTPAEQQRPYLPLEEVADRVGEGSRRQKEQGEKSHPSRRHVGLRAPWGNGSRL